MTVAIFETSVGSFTCRLLPDAAPKAVENFIGLAKRGYYEDVIFHRIISDFMIQGGDPSGTGYGGKSIWEIPFEDEISPEWHFDRPGILAMANTGRPRSNGSQFFLTLKATPWLNDRHTIFGEVIEGYEVVELLGAVEVGAQDKPIEDVKLLTVTIEERAAE
jgi:peptidylprolyl isomerase